MVTHDDRYFGYADKEYKFASGQCPAVSFRYSGKMHHAMDKLEYE